MMVDPPRSPTTDYYNVLGISKGASIKEMCMAYKSLVMKWHPDRNPSNKAEAEAKFQEINEAFMALSGREQEEKLLSFNDPPTSSPSPRGYNHHKSLDDYFTLRPSLLLKSLSRRSRTPSKSPRRLRKNCASPKKSPTSTTPSPGSTRSKSAYRRSPTTESDGPSFSRSMSRSTTSPTPIVYSQTTARRRPSPIEKKLECTLEELCHGCVKNVMFTRDVIKNGIIEKEQEMLQIIVQPGWKKGTKITFEGKGDERPGYLPADITFLIDEKEHPLFSREGDDLLFGVEIPLIDALTGCIISVPLLGGESMDLTFTEILYPGCEQVIKGQGMPKTKGGGRRGDLKVKFFVGFPTELSDEQRSSILGILQDCI